MSSTRSRTKPTNSWVGNKNLPELSKFKKYSLVPVPKLGEFKNYPLVSVSELSEVTEVLLVPVP